MKNTIKLIAGGLLLASVPALAQNFWTSQGTSLNWSDAGNWTAGVPDGSSIVWFEDLNYTTGYTNAAGAVNNIATAGSVAAAANYVANSFSTTNRFYTTLIPGGVTLTLGGYGASYPALSVGDVPTVQWLSAGSWTNYTTITGAGSLVVNDGASLISVGQRNRATLDLSGLNTFTGTAKQLLVGATTDNPTATLGIAGALLLGKTNTLTTAANLSAPGVILGSFNLASSTGILLLGGTNTINTDGLVVGGRRATGTLLAFAPAYSNTVTAGNLKLRGSAGGSSRVGTFSIGDLAAQPADYLGGVAGGSTGSADFSGGAADLRADNVYVGRSAVDPGPLSSFTDGNGTLILERGSLDANNLYIGYKQGTNGSRGVGTLTLKSNALMVVNSGVSLAFRNNVTNGSQAATATLNVNDTAVLNVGGNITHGDGGISTIALGGGSIGMTSGGSIYAYGLSGAGSITNASTVTVTNNFTPGTLTTAGTLNLAGNLSLNTGLPLTFNLGNSTTAGAAGINDYVNVTGNATFTANTVSLDLNGPLVAGGTYHLIDFTGSRSGSVTLNNTTRSPLGLDQATAGHLDLIATNWTPGNLVWSGVTNVWNTSLTNWNPGSTDRFFQYDSVTFDDTGVTNLVWIQGIVSPSSITISGTKDYVITNRSSFVNNGGISGYTSITKNGTGIFQLGTASNTFTGPINVNNGVLRPFDPTFTTPGNASVLGATNAASILYVNSGGTFDFNNIGSISGGKRFIIQGNGFNGMGAITNGGTAAGATLNGYLITLAGDTMVAAQNGGWGIRGFGTGGPFYSGQLNLQGYTLTKLGSHRLAIQDVMATDAGTINFGGGHFQIQNSVITGAGSLNFSNNTFVQFAFAAGATSYVAKAINTLGNFGILTPASGSAASQVLIDSTVSLGGSFAITNNQTLIHGGAISGSFDLTKYGTSNLVLNAANTYNGNTLITAGTLTLGAGGSVNNSPQLVINPGAALDVTAKAGAYTIAAGQTLTLNGVAAGDVTVGANSTLLGAGAVNGSLTLAVGGEIALGTTNVTGTTTVASNLNLAGGHLTWELAPSLEISDAFVVNGNLNLSGVNVFTVNSIGGFDPSGTNTLITYTGTLTGGLPNLVVNSSARFIVEFVNPALTPGKIQIRLVTPSPNLVWKGGDVANPTRWDVKTTPNWDNGGSPDVFWSSDLVTFDDTSVTNVVSLVGTLGPASITFNNNSVNYFLGGSGGLVAASLTNNASAGVTISNTATTFLTGDGLVLNSGAITFSQPTNASLVANLVGSGTFVKAGSSNLLLIGKAENFSGSINVNGGQLRAGSTNAVASTVNVASGATLDVNGQLLTAAVVTANGAGADGFGALNNRGGGRTNSLANVTLSGATTFGALSNAWGINGTLSGGDFLLTKTNANDVWIQTGSDTGLGDIDVRQGRLVFAREGTTLGNTAKEIIVRTGATLALAATNQMNQTGPGTPGIAAGTKTLTMMPAATFESIGFPVNSTTVNSFDGAISITTNAVFKVGGNSRLVLTGPISGNSHLILTNNGTLYLGGTNTYASNTFVYSGTLVLTNSQSLPTNGVLFISNNISTFGNASLVFDNNPVFPVTNVMRLSSQNGIVSVGGNGTWNGPILMHGSNSANNFTFSGGTDLLDLAGPLITTNVGAVPITFHGSNTRLRGALLAPLATVSIGVGDGLSASFDERFTTVTFDKSNIWSGTTVIDRGRVNLGTNNALPPSVPIRVGTLAAGVSDRRIIFDLRGYNQTISSLAETAVGDSRVLIGNSSTNSNSILTYAGTGTNTWGAIISDILDAPDVPHTTGLMVTSGVLNLVNTNTYTGATLVSGGRLNLILGSGLTAGYVGQLGNSPVTVSGTGTLGGNGLIHGPVTNAVGGTVSPGVGVGTLTVETSVDLNAGSVTWMEVNNSVGTNDLLVASSGVTYGGTLVVTNLTPLVGYTNGQVLTLFSSGAGYNGSFNAIVIPGVITYDATQLAVNGTITIVSAVSTAPAPLTTTQLAGNMLQLDWPADHTGWRLQTQTNSLNTGLSGIWYDVPGSTSVNSTTQPIVPGNPTVFFRLIYP